MKLTARIRNKVRAASLRAEICYKETSLILEFRNFNGEAKIENLLLNKIESRGYASELHEKKVWAL